MCCNDCKNIDAGVIDGPCATCQITGGPTLNFEFVPGRRNAPDPDKEGAKGRDLAIWWEAYRAAIPPVTHQDTIIDIANDALAAYKAKAAELRSK